jgi:hypothetical protein
MSDSTAKAARRERENSAFNHAIIFQETGTEGEKRGLIHAYEAGWDAGWEARNTQVQVTDDMVRRLVIREGRSPENAYATKLAREKLEAVLNPAIAAALEKRER